MTSENTGEDFLASQPSAIPKHPQKQLDLHGHNVFEAEPLVRCFLDDSFAESLVFVRIITGHGKSSAVGYSVLYSEVKNMLQRLSEGRVYDYSFTPHTGYFDVFLRYERH